MLAEDMGGVKTGVAALLDVAASKRGCTADIIQNLTGNQKKQRLARFLRLPHTRDIREFHGQRRP